MFWKRSTTASSMTCSSVACCWHKGTCSIFASELSRSKCCLHSGLQQELRHLPALQQVIDCKADAATELQDRTLKGEGRLYMHSCTILCRSRLSRSLWTSISCCRRNCHAGGTKLCPPFWLLTLPSAATAASAPEVFLLSSACASRLPLLLYCFCNLFILAS